MSETTYVGGEAVPRSRVFTEENLQHLDDTMREVFGVQFGIDISVCTAPAKLEARPIRCHEQTAIIGFAGAISGVCELRLSVPASIAITQAMLPDTAIEEKSEWICDAVGELCNLVAGGWKNRLPELGAECSLTIPTVVAGDDYQIHRPANVLVAHRNYLFSGHSLLLTLVYDPS